VCRYSEVKAQMLQAHQSAVDLYRARLGLRFEIGDDQAGAPARVDSP
jgi:hypothetical protein